MDQLHVHYTYTHIPLEGKTPPLNPIYFGNKQHKVEFHKITGLGCEAM